MILMYHKVDLIAPTRWWVRAEVFARQMEALAGYRVVYLEEYDPADPSHCVVTFDDGYENLVRHALPVLAQHGYPFEVFVNGDLLGGWNRFDLNKEPLTRIATVPALARLAAAGGRLQWHTASHPDLARVGFGQALREMFVPDRLRERFPAPHFTWFSYPYGSIGAQSEKLARALFHGAVAVEDGDPTDRYRLPRVVADEALEITPAGAPRPGDAAWFDPALRAAARERALAQMHRMYLYQWETRAAREPGTGDIAGKK